MGKTNTIRIIEKAQIVYSEAYYAYDENDLSGMHAAQVMGMPPEQVFKTLVASGERTGIHVFCIPVCCELDLKKAAIAAGDKSIQLLPVKQLLPVTGFIRGGCSPIGMKKSFPTHIEESCLLFDRIAVSAGERGHQVMIAPQDLVTLTQAQYSDLIL